MPVWRSKTVQCPAISHILLRLVKCTAKLTPDAEQLDSLIGPGGLVLVNLQPIWFSFMGGVGKK
jgi:hypothetical protein